VRILLSNDDGYFSPGITLLAEVLAPLAEVTIVAPERDRSGASNSLTLDRPLTVREARDRVFFVNGTPTDCVHLAVTGLLAELPDLVISGINHGANMGDDTIYSGTVAAATEGFLLGIPSIAISLAAEPVLLNVNVPDIAHGALQGIEVTRLGKRHKAEAVVKSSTPRGDTVYWVGAAGAAQDSGEGTDFHAVASRRVSVTPLQMDLTRFSQLETVRKWMTHDR